MRQKGGFRNYDPQIARFTQLDPLTWDYPELTNYQYASNEPIANVDMDGLEKLQALEPVVIFKDWQKAAPILTKNLIPSALNLSIQMTARTDNTFAQLNSIRPDAKLISKSETESNLWHLLNKLSDWFDQVSHGSGSYQDYGIVFSGNDKGKGEIQFRDHAGEILDYIDLGPSFFPALESAGLDPKVFEELLNSPAGLKYVAHAAEAAKSVKDVTQIVLEGVKNIHISSIFRKEGNVIFRRDVGWNVKVNKDGSNSLTNEPANDTFPPKKIFPEFVNPIK